ncbi:MAG: hypothetical protein H5T24_08815 [Bacteroidales bacterium]|nr:hypothetical protein [Bacteroidales bacterium]
MKRLATVLAIMVAALTSCYKGKHTFTVTVTGNQDTYIVSYLDNKGEWQDSVTVKHGFSIYNEYDDDWRLDMIAIGDSVHVAVYSRNKLVEQFAGRERLEIHEIVPY